MLSPLEELRCEALRRSIESFTNGTATPDQVVARADSYFKFLNGEAKQASVAKKRNK